MSSESYERLVAPGFGKSISWSDNRFLPNGVNGWSSAGVTLRELRLMQIMDRLTDKDNWHIKIFDEEIVSKWRDEAFASGEDVTQAMMAWCIEELRDKAQEFQQDRMVVTYDREVCIVKADDIVDSHFKHLLKSAILPLEALNDWHPGSDQTVLDLVHPSLYPLIYGRSRILPRGTVSLESTSTFIGRGELLQTPELPSTSDTGDTFWSSKFQWLPSDVSVQTVNGTYQSRIVSYINNLHPLEHNQLYRVLEHVTNKVIPMWDKLFVTIDHPTPERIAYPEEPFIWPRGKTRPDSEKGSDENVNEAEYLEWEWYSTQREVAQPEPDQYERFERPHQISRFLQAVKDLNSLQVIYKLANIHLTPENPEYSGGSWHIEGMLNEHIVSTAIYYYDCENITDSFLCFRQSIARAAEDDDGFNLMYEQNEYQGIEQIYGIENEGPAIQDYGRVLTKEDRLLVFPNVLQHRVAPFKLLDQTKPGHRKIIAMFLVDPNIRIISTANVPPQQKKWWSPHFRNIEPFASLPQEIFDEIIDHVEDFPISLDEAKAVRLELMAERTVFVDNVNESYDEITFSFCEH